MRALSLLLLLPLACRLPLPERAEPMGDLPLVWQTPAHSTNEPPSDWWRQWGSDELASFVAEALKASPNVKVAQARVEQARLRAELAGAELMPQASVSLEGNRQQNNFIGLPIPGDTGGVLTSRSTSYRLSFATSWELDLWGRIRAGQLAALADADATGADLEGARQSLAAHTARAWVLLAESRRQTGLVEAHLKIAEASAQQAQVRYELGVRPALDLHLAQTHLAILRSQLEQWGVAKASAVRQLEVLLGRYPKGAIPEPADFPRPLDAVPAGLPSGLLGRRPDIVAARLRLLSSDARVLEARAEWYPKLSLTASTGIASPELERLLDNDLSVWSLGANLLQPLFAGGRLRANLKLKESMAGEAVAAYRGVVLNAFAEVETALATEGLLAARHQKLESAVALATGTLRLAQDRHGRGLEPFLTVVDAQARITETQSQRIAVQRQRLENRINLHLALGGGFVAANPDSVSQKARP